MSKNITELKTNNSQSNASVLEFLKMARIFKRQIRLLKSSTISAEDRKKVNIIVDEVKQAIQTYEI